MAFDIRDLLTSSSVTREVVTQVYVYIIESITGESPNINREQHRTYISWRPGQAKKLQDFLAAQFEEKPMTAKEVEAGPPSLLPFSEVIVDTKSVLTPLLIKKTWPLAVAGMAAGALLTTGVKKSG